MLPNPFLRQIIFFNGIFGFAASLLGPLYAVYVQRLSPDVLVISGSWAAFLVSAAVFIFIISRIGDRLDKEFLLAAGYLVRALVWFGYIFVGDITFLLVLQVLLGLGEALGSPAFDAIYAEHLDRYRHIQDYSDWKLIQVIFIGAGTVVGGLVVDRYGFVPLFLLMTMLAVFSFFGAVFKLRPADLRK